MSQRVFRMLEKQDTGITQLLETLSNTLSLPKEAAHAMPVEYYTSPELLELETDEVLLREQEIRESLSAVTIRGVMIRLDR